MKKNFIPTLGIFLLVACNNAETAKTPPAGDTASTAKHTFAYSLDHPADSWTPGDLAHVETVLKALKAYETGDIASCIENFGDSVKLEFDNFEATVSKDSLKSMFTADRAKLSKIGIRMGDWESVISKDKKTEYVSLWYKETTTDLGGKTDSLEYMDDLKISNGKIVGLNEKSRRLAAHKK